MPFCQSAFFLSQGASRVLRAHLGKSVLLPALLPMMLPAHSLVAQSVTFRSTVAAQHSGKCLDVLGMSQPVGSPVQQYPCNQSPTQTLQFASQPDGTYTISPSTATSLCLDEGSSQGGITQQTCDAGAASQRWQANPAAAGGYNLVGQSRNDCADVYGISMSNAATIGTWNCNGQANQRFGITIPAIQPPDSQESYLTTPNIPLPGPQPLNATVGLPSGLSFDGSGGTQVVGMRFGTAGANVNVQTGQQLRNIFFTNTMEGNMNNAIGSPMDNAHSDNTTFAAVARTYPVGNTNDLIPVLSDGVHLRAACSNNHTDCSPGHVYGGLLTLPQVEIRPGMVVKVRYKTAKGDHSWPAIWLFSITQQPPASGSKNIYDGTAERHACGDGGSGSCMETDINDNYSRFGQGVATGHQIDFGNPNIYGAPWSAGLAPRFTYGSTGNGYVTHVNAGPDFTEVTAFDMSQTFHDLTLNWHTDGNMDVFIDNVLITSAYEDFTKSTYYTKNGQQVPVGMELLLENQAIPSFAPGASSNNAGIQENDGLGIDGWSMVIQEIGIWQGNIANPANYEPTTQSAY